MNRHIITGRNNVGTRNNPPPGVVVGMSSRPPAAGHPRRARRGDAAKRPTKKIQRHSGTTCWTTAGKRLSETLNRRHEGKTLEVRKSLETTHTKHARDP